MSSCTSCTWKSFMRPYCLVKICKFKLLYIIRISHVNVIRILNAESPTGIQKLHPMQATPSHRLLSLDPSHQRRKSMSGSLYGCPKQSLQISEFLFTQLGKPKMSQNWRFEHVVMMYDVTMQMMHLMLIYVWLFKKNNMTRSQSHWALCICAHDRQDVAGLDAGLAVWPWGGLSFPRGTGSEKFQQEPTWNKMPEPRPCTW